MTALHRIPTLAIWTLAVVFVTACQEPGGTPTGPGPEHSVSGTQDGLIDLPGVRVDLPLRVRSSDTSDAALREAVEREAGFVAVGFKEPGADRTLQTGFRAALTAATFAAGLDAIKERGGQIRYVRKHRGSAEARVPPEVATELRQDPLVDYVEPRQWGRLDRVPLVPSAAATLRAMQGCNPYTQECIPWGVIYVNARQAQLQGSGRFGGRVLIIDTGHDRGHEDLPLVWPSHCGGVFDGCTDFFVRPHGTHVLGTLVARDNSIGIVGTAPLVTPSQVYVWGAADPDSVSMIQVANGLDNGITWGVQVVNMSLTDTGYNLDLANAVAAAEDAEMLLVAAAGNIQYSSGLQQYIGTGVKYPAAYSGVIGVSGILPDSNFAHHGHDGPTSPWCPGPGFDPDQNPGSNYGSHVDLTSAFFSLSTAPADSYEDYDDGVRWCGTSMATPYVAGVATIVRAKYPDLCQDQVAQILFNTGVDLGTPGRDDYYGYGLPDAVAALALAAVTTPCPPPPIQLDVTISGPTRIRPGATCTWYAVVQPPGGYNYQWYNENFPVGTASYYTGGKLEGTVGDRFTLRVDVDGSGGVGSASITVRESASAPICIV